MHFVSSTVLRLLLKLIASCIKFVEPGFMTNVVDVDDKRVPRLRQRKFVFISVAAVPSMSEKDIDVEILLSAIVFRTDINTMES